MEKNDNLPGKEFHRNPYYVEKDERCMNSKLKTFNDDKTTNFDEKGIPKTNIAYDCFSLIIFDSITRENVTYDPQIYLEE